MWHILCLNQSALSNTKACNPNTAPPAANHNDSTRGEERANAHSCVYRSLQREMMAIRCAHFNGETGKWLDIDDVVTDHDKRAVSNESCCERNRQQPGVDGCPMWEDIYRQ